MDPIRPIGLTDEEINAIEDTRINELNELGIDEQDVLAQARQNLNIWQNYFNENITIGKDDVKFATQDQWSSVERTEFTRLFKVCLQSNKIIDTVNKICGEQRKNKPDLMVRSINGRSSQDMINLREDLVRSISYESQNDLIYQQAFRMALLLGWGAFQVDVDYESPRSFNKIIKYKMITDPTKASWDPSAVKPHKGDGDYCSYQYAFSKEQFAATYPHIINPTSYADPRLFLDFQWETRDTIILCDYFIKEWFPIKMLRLSDGRFVTEDEWKKIQKTEVKIKSEIAESSTAVKDIIKELIPVVIGERRSQDFRIMRYHLIKDRILEFSEWPSKYLPIIFCDGNSDFVEGRQYTKSYVHEARDMQKYINFLLSERATEIKNRRKEQWLGTPDNISGQEQLWRNPDTQTGILLAKPDPKTGQMPTKQPAWQLSGELLAESQLADSNLREILGFNEAMDLQGRDMSGKARRERKLEGSMACYVQFDNLGQAIAQSGRVVLDLLPYVFGEDERHMIITRKDGKSESIVLNKQNPDGSVSNRIEGGEYDIEISSGPSFAVQKEMALEFFQQTIAANPQVFNLVADLWAENLDIQYRDQVVDRFKTLVPPQILAKEEGKELPPQPPSPQEQAMQMEMQLRQAQLQERQEELRLRQEAHVLEKEKHELEKLEMMLKAEKMKSEIIMDAKDRDAETRKIDLDYAAKMSKIISDMRKH